MLSHECCVGNVWYNLMSQASYYEKSSLTELTEHLNDKCLGRSPPYTFIETPSSKANFAEAFFVILRAFLAGSETIS